jgi:hypothetical protein
MRFYSHAVYGEEVVEPFRLVLPITGMGQGEPSTVPGEGSRRRRLSEQETRLLFAFHLERLKQFYGIEVPTTRKYRQKGRTYTAARSDLAVFCSADPADRLMNIELKNGEPHDFYRKDLEKLLCEGTNGLWFQSVDKRNTLKRALGHLANQATYAVECTCEERYLRNGVWARRKHVSVPIKRRTLTFAFCCLERGDMELYLGNVDLQGDGVHQGTLLSELLRAELTDPRFWLSWSSRELENTATDDL